MDLAESLNTEAEILLSHTVMSAVVDKLEPHKRARKPSQVSQVTDAARLWLEDQGLLYAMAPRERWIQLLQKNIKVKPSIDSSILKISFGDEDPEWAARLVNAAIDQYIVEHVRVFSGQGTAPIYLERMQSAEADLRQRRAELERQKQKFSIVAIDDTRRELVRRSGETAALQQAAQNELDSLLFRFDNGHREIDAARAKLDRAVAVSKAVHDALVRLESDQARVDEAQLMIASLESTYKEYARRYDEARLTDMASASSINVAAIDHAQVPTRPENSRLLLMLIAAAGGSVLALLVAVLREYFDRRLAEPAAAEDILGIPGMGSVARLAPRHPARIRPAPGLSR
jgi:uncharacterized protein involved in exopolysaccharide biosynthesis